MNKKITKIITASILSLGTQDQSWAENLNIEVTQTKDLSHGDFSCNVAMRLSKILKLPPLDIAKKIINAIETIDGIEKIEVAHPGFINIFLTKSEKTKILKKILSKNDGFATEVQGSKGSILLEFVSSNPTGPLHVGHGRHAAYGATLGNILEAVGYKVHREYYVNDAGRQMDILCVSVIIRKLESKKFNISLPSSGYQGDYIREIARSIELKNEKNIAEKVIQLSVYDNEEEKEQHIDQIIFLAKEELGLNEFNAIKTLALESIRSDIEEDLREFDVIFDTWFSEHSLTEEGHIEKALKILDAQKLLYKKDGAIWFKATEFGDEKDRVVTRENNNNTYFTSDIAYHHNKKDRGFDHLIDILGSDHHGYIARVKAGLIAMGHMAEDLEVDLVQFVSLFRAGIKQSMSTRSGEFITLRQLREEVGNDAARFFYIMRSNEQHLDFDLELAKSKSNENPVYYIQYAHARIASVFRQLDEKNLTYEKNSGNKNLTLLKSMKEKNIMSLLSRYPETLELSANNRAPHNLAQYLRDLATEFHSYYNDSTFIVDESNIRNARLTLIKATQIVLYNGLKLLGVSAPEIM